MKLLGSHVSNSVLMRVFIWLGVFTGLRGEWQRSAEVHEGDGGLILFAFDTQYANRQTMTFAVLFSLWYCCLSKQKEHDVAAYRFACASAQLMHLPGASIFLSWLHEPRPWSTNHMKGLPSVRIALSKVTLMYEKRAGVFERKSYRCRSARGGENQWHVWSRVLSCLLGSLQTRYTVFKRKTSG